MTVYFTSDLHLGHRAVIGMQERPFDDVEQMNRRLIQGINQRVGMRDTLWVLGDVSHRIGKETAAGLLSKVTCRDVRLVRGNHDKDWGAEGAFVEVCDYKELSLDGMRVCLMHYPLASWNGKHRGSGHLHGHVHAGPGYNEAMAARGVKRYDVGVDANGYLPVSWEEVRSFMEDRGLGEFGDRFDPGHHGLDELG